MSAGLLVGALSLAIWAYLLFARGGFWRATERDDLSASRQPADAEAAVTAVIPARDEADAVGRAVSSLLSQRPALDVVLVDDQSSDGTAEAAGRAAAELGASDRLRVLSGRPLPGGWTGKLWALQQGIDHVLSRSAPAEFLLLTDADIAYAPDSLAALVAEAKAEGLVLNSRMAKLCCTNPAERALIPAFIFFFQMLYPFAWVNQPTRAIAAAAGGCMLLRREALLAAGGIESIRGELIDDCALARRMKAKGPIRLMLTERVRSLRPYAGIGEIRRMVARSAYAQLRYSPLLLLGTAAGMALTYLAPPLLALFGGGAVRLLGLASWAAMAFAFQPVLRFYRLSPLWGLALPAIATVYFAFTLDSAWQHWHGRGGFWKGRSQAPRSEAA
ncbi:MAG TPA: glycosyltransferase [Dongiaceae bacterium]|jgi:hopene-associated glycosyltransferase HpnB|nr:glycosyltransferase [Dongiaceae bacterium]